MSGNPFHTAEEAKEISEVNVVPLADVSLVLLIILLTISPMMTQTLLRIQTAGKDSNAPAETPAQPLAATPEKPPELVLVVGLAAEGITVGDRIFTSPGQFMAFISGELAKRSDRKVFLAPQPEVEHGRVVNMLEMLKDCGASSAALVQSEAP